MCWHQGWRRGTCDLLHVNNAFNICEVSWKYFGLNYFSYHSVIFIISEKCWAGGWLRVWFSHHIRQYIRILLGEGEMVNQQIPFWVPDITAKFYRRVVDVFCFPVFLLSHSYTKTANDSYDDDQNCQWSSVHLTCHICNSLDQLNFISTGDFTPNMNFTFFSECIWNILQDGSHTGPQINLAKF